MAEEKWTNGNLALQKKAPHVITIEAKECPQDIQLRVAAYARVSTSSEDQLNSFAAQSKYYTTLISSNENWKMVDLYADEGISGTSAEKRGDFQRLMADCRRGLVDRVLVKSISRFARNTKECLEAIRELKSLGISVCFEKEHIDTATLSGEMITTIFASIAQGESESTSRNMRLGIKMRMMNGEFNTCFAPYGYRLENHKLTIIPEEASVVQRIFSEYLNGKTSRTIARELNAECPRNRPWRRELIEYILKNERYAGNALLQKRYSTDTFPPQQKRNKGEREMYFVQNSNDAIVDLEIFERVQRLRARREVQRVANPRYFSNKMRCGVCGSTFRTKIQNGKIYWSCRTHEENASDCIITQIPEVEIQNAFLRLYYKLKHHGNGILSEMMKSLQIIRNRRMLWSVDIIELNKKISTLSSQNQVLATLKQQGLIDPDIFISQSNELTKQLRDAKLSKERLLAADSDNTIDLTKELMEILDAGPDILNNFDEELFGDLIDMVIVDSNEQLRFRLKNGLELVETIERTIR